MLLQRLWDEINTALHKKQAGFRTGRNFCKQVLSITSFIEYGFEKAEKRRGVHRSNLYSSCRKWFRVIIARVIWNILNNRTLAVTHNEERDSSDRSSRLFYLGFTQKTPKTGEQKCIYDIMLVTFYLNNKEARVQSHLTFCNANVKYRKVSK